MEELVEEEGEIELPGTEGSLSGWGQRVPDASFLLWRNVASSSDTPTGGPQGRKSTHRQISVGFSAGPSGERGRRERIGPMPLCVFPDGLMSALCNISSYTRPPSCT